MPTLREGLRSLVHNTAWLRAPYLRMQFRRSLRATAAAWAGLPAAAREKPQAETFIFSRYGTETVGNHFIQLGLLRLCCHLSPTRPVYLLSAAPAVTEKGLAGMKEVLKRSAAGAPLAHFIEERVQVVREDGIRRLGPGDLLILGGGPIMDDPALAQWESWFQWAKRAGARVFIAGCGLGPLRRKETIAISESLLGMADAVVLRNKPEENFARAAGPEHIVAPDPAFLCAPLFPATAAPRKRLLAVNARLIGFDSNPGKKIATDEIVERVASHALSVRECLPIDGVFPFSTQEDVNSPDSAVAVRAAQAIAERLRIPLLPLPEASMPGLVDALSQAEFVLSMRMHGFILGMLLGCRAAGLDYIANEGKCTDFYRDWLGHDSSPSLYVPGSLRCDDFVSLSDLDGNDVSGDMLLDAYATALRQSLTP
jgi:polysaccharide pyruvyl transferase WcaK-like protein